MSLAFITAYLIFISYFGLETTFPLQGRHHMGLDFFVLMLLIAGWCLYRIIKLNKLRKEYKMEI